ncbi:MAG: CPBP family intramembrane metalloprotease, partial [Clostridiaceae bacterium]|nr:CPBP family intramembrane metalloprotease [Clostridiaceae bacterium]
IEEIFFRRIILQRFMIKYSVTKAIIYSSLIFMLGHIYRGGFDSFIFSIIVSIIFLKTRMVVVCILFHSVYNLIADSIITDQYLKLLTHIAGIDINITTLADMAKLVTSSKIIVILTIGIIFSLLIIILFLYKNWPKENLETISLN